MDYQIDTVKQRQLNILESKIKSLKESLNKDVITFIFNKYAWLKEFETNILDEDNIELRHFTVFEENEEDIDEDEITGDIEDILSELSLDAFEFYGNITYRREEFIHE